MRKNILFDLRYHRSAKRYPTEPVKRFGWGFICSAKSGLVASCLQKERQNAFPFFVVCFNFLCFKNQNFNNVTKILVLFA